MGLTNGVMFGSTFGTEPMRELFSDESFVSTFLDVEAALAQAQADAGVIPEWAAKDITRQATLEHVSMERIESNVEQKSLFSMSIIEAWKEELDDAGEYLHWGASTQDISDTVFVLLLQEAIDIFREELSLITDLLASLAKEQRDVRMVGRTQHVNGPPITLGFKVATWLDEIDRHRDRLSDVEDRLSVVEFAGASGTLAAVGENGLEILDRFAEALDLRAPRIGWTATRDRFAEVMNLFATIAGTLARIGQQILLLNRPEFGEVTEAVPGDQISSSTNPHKQNPVLSQHTVGLARLVRGYAAVMLELLTPFDERDRSTWYVEFAVIPRSTNHLHRMLINTLENLRGLDINPEAMRENIQRSGSLVLSEAVMMALAERLGRQTAHEIVADAAKTVIDEGVAFETALSSDPRVSEHLSETDIESITDPQEYTGFATEFVDRVLETDESQ